MSYEKVKEYFNSVGLGERVVVTGWVDVCKGWYVNDNE